MPIMLDTGFFYALLQKKDSNHTRAQEIFKELVKGRYGRIYTSEHIFDETMTLLNVRTRGKRKDLLRKMADFFIGEQPIAQLLRVDFNWFDEIIDLQVKMTKDNNPVSFTFDEHFKGMLEWIY
ncbi:MAG: PIN domain-containing protein [Promethearchaeota archaeon]